MWDQTRAPIAEITAWVTLAYIYSMKEDVVGYIWNAQERDDVGTRIIRDLHSNLILQDPTGGGWKPIDGVPLDEVRTYSTVMALWSELEAMRTPNVREIVRDSLTDSVYRGLHWLKGTFNETLSGWVPKPSRSGQTIRYRGLTSQIICVILIAQSLPEFSSIADWEAFKKAKTRFILEMVPRDGGFASIQDDQIETRDQAVPPVLELEGSTFQWYPWMLAACEMLKRDAHLPPDQRNTVTREFDELAKKYLQEFHAKLLSGSAETYTVAESLCAVSLAR